MQTTNYQSEQWRNLRTKKLRQSNRCGICGSKHNLDVFELIDKPLAEITTADLRTLCEGCRNAAATALKAGINFKSDGHHSRWATLKNHLLRVRANPVVADPVKSESVKITREFIEAGSSSAGGWNRKQLECLGVTWPPAKGWKHNAIGNLITRAKAARFLSLRKE